MTHHRRYQLLCAAGSFILGLFGTVTARRGLWWETGMFAFVALFLIEASLREGRAHRRVLAEHEHARRATLGEQPEPLDPCCTMWFASGAVHSSACTGGLGRLTAALQTSELDDLYQRAEQAEADVMQTWELPRDWIGPLVRQHHDMPLWHLRQAGQGGPTPEFGAGKIPHPRSCVNCLVDQDQGRHSFPMADTWMNVISAVGGAVVGGAAAIASPLLLHKRSQLQQATVQAKEDQEASLARIVAIRTATRLWHEVLLDAFHEVRHTEGFPDLAAFDDATMAARVQASAAIDALVHDGFWIRGSGYVEPLEEPHQPGPRFTYGYAYNPASSPSAGRSNDAGPIIACLSRATRLLRAIIKSATVPQNDAIGELDSALHAVFEARTQLTNYLLNAVETKLGTGLLYDRYPSGGGAPSGLFGTPSDPRPTPAPQRRRFLRRFPRRRPPRGTSGI
ncbi:hypothetical protein [Streptomyces sp. NBC_00145]|uniref:hypothetical protein n=1 Tax=Streptomyces sp. NBC_00145 TaxID=2975666 RepID=UPI002E18B413